VRDLQVRIRLRVPAQNAPSDLGRCCRSSFSIFGRQWCAVQSLGCTAPVCFWADSKIEEGKVYPMKNICKLLCTLLALIMLLTAAAFAETPTQDRAGNEIAIPAQINKVISLAPATTQIIESLGMMDKLIAVDTQTPLYVEGVSGLPQFDMMQPDIEQIAALMPDVVFTSGMSYVEDNPFAVLPDMGICVIEIPSSSSIAAVKEDIVFTAACLGAEAEGQAIADGMQARIDEIAAIGATIEEKKSVLFEIAALPYIYSFGSGTFLDEMITLLGAQNVLADQYSWLSVNEEDAVAANPDVILTSVNYIEDSVGEIMSRPGWEAVTAVANGDVHYIDNGKSSLPNHHIVDALIEMAVAVYPEAYAAYAE